MRREISRLEIGGDPCIFCGDWNKYMIVIYATYKHGKECFETNHKICSKCEAIIKKLPVYISKQKVEKKRK
jgi:hypothetical protein